MNDCEIQKKIKLRKIFDFNMLEFRDVKFSIIIILEANKAKGIGRKWLTDIPTKLQACN